MKKRWIELGLILASVLALTNCTKELDKTEPVIPEGETFELLATTPQTKTVNEGLDTKWELADKLAVFYGETAGSTYSSGQVFTCDDVNGHFTGKLDPNKVLSETNDWYAFYSSAIDKGVLQENFKTPMKSSWITFGANIHYSTPQVQKQKGTDNMSHIAGDRYPLYGEAKSVAKDVVPAIEMSHLSTVIKIDVTNESGQILNITDIEVEAPAEIPLVGLFTYENAPGKKLLTKVTDKVSNVARLEVTGGTVENQGTASFYIGTVPFALKKGDCLKFRVNGYERTLELSQEATFLSGKIKTIPFTFNKKINALAHGNYVIAAKDDKGEFYAMKNTPISSRLDQMNIGVVADLSADYEALENSILWTVEQVSGKTSFAIKDQAGKYLTWGGTAADDNQAQLSEVQVELDLVPDNRGMYSLQLTDGTRQLAWNKSSKGFAFYSLNTSMDKEICFIPAHLTTRTHLAKPIVTAVPDGAAGKITVNWEPVANAASYIVTCTGQSDKNSASGDLTVTFTGLAFGSYDIAVKAIPSDVNLYIESKSDLQTVKLIDPNIKLEIGDYVEIKTTDDFTDGDYIFYGEKKDYLNPGALHNAIVNSTIKSLRPVHLITKDNVTFIKSNSLSADLQNQIIWTYNSSDKTLYSLTAGGVKHYLTYQYGGSGNGATSLNVVSDKSSDEGQNQWLPMYIEPFGLTIVSQNSKETERALCSNFGGTKVAIGAYKVSNKYLPVRIFKKKEK